MPRSYLYSKLADDLELQIRSGVYRAGERVPSVRQLKQERGVSVATITHALAELEARGLVEARPRSGYFVSFTANRLRAPDLKKHRVTPRRVPLPHLADDFVTASADTKLVPLGGAVLSPDLLPLKHLTRTIREVAGRRERVFGLYGPPSGAPELQRAVAKRLLRIGVPVTADEVVITSGCMNAIQLALLAITKPGDVVALESPTFFGFLQLVRDLGLYALEVPTDPQTGIDLQSLHKALAKHTVKALIVTPSFHNPTGAAMPEDHKTELAVLARHFKVTIIEDDVYGDLHYGARRPSTLAGSPDSDVLYCSSFSKTLAPGLRVGFLVPGQHLDRVRRLKLSGTITSPPLNQLTVAAFLRSGAYERHLRQLRGKIKIQVAAARRALGQHLPAGSEVTSPTGGFLLWTKLPRGVDSVALYEEMKVAGISFCPGPLCASDAKYRNYLRISAGYPWTRSFEQAIAKLGQALVNSTG